MIIFTILMYYAAFWAVLGISTAGGAYTYGLTVRFLFEPRDFWIGIFWDDKRRRLYLLPFPMIGVVVYE